MAIQYSGGTARNDVYPGITTYPDLLDSIDTTLVAAGWTSVSLPGFNNFVYTGQPGDGNTLGLGAATYTFRTVINNATPREVLIGASADDTYENFVAAVTGGPGSGTAYSSATVTNTQFTASIPVAGTVRVATILTGGSTVGIALPDGTVNGAWQYTSLGGGITAFGGYQWTSAATPAGLRISVIGWIRDFDSGPSPIQIRFILADSSLSVVNPANYLTGSLVFDPGVKTLGARLGTAATLPSSTWRVIATQYQMFVFADTIYTGAGIYVAAGVPWIPDFLFPKSIQAATATSPIVVTTTAPHDWTTGNVVNISGINGLEGANGTFTVTVLSLTTAELDGSTGTGTYTNGGRAAKTNVALATCGWMQNGFSSSAAAWYTQLAPVDYAAQILNGSVNNVAGSPGDGTVSLVEPNDVRLAEGANATTWYNTDVLASEPILSMGVSDAGTPYLVGQLWDSFFHSQAESGGTTGTFGAKNWYILTNNATGSSAEKEGALVLLVP